MTRSKTRRTSKKPYKPPVWRRPFPKPLGPIESDGDAYHIYNCIRSNGTVSIKEIASELKMGVYKVRMIIKSLRFAKLISSCYLYGYKYGWNQKKGRTVFYALANVPDGQARVLTNKIDVNRSRLAKENVERLSSEKVKEVS